MGSFSVHLRKLLGKIKNDLQALPMLGSLIIDFLISTYNQLSVPNLFQQYY